MTTWLFAHDPRPARTSSGSISGPVDRLVLEQRERAERSRAAREEMLSSGSSATEKIRAWERLHGLNLPRDPNPIVLDLVARDTGLTLREVLAEQGGRAATARGTRQP